MRSSTVSIHSRTRRRHCDDGNSNFQYVISSHYVAALKKKSSTNTLRSHFLPQPNTKNTDQTPCHLSGPVRTGRLQSTSEMTQGRKTKWYSKNNCWPQTAERIQQPRSLERHFNEHHIFARGRYEYTSSPHHVARTPRTRSRTLYGREHKKQKMKNVGTLFLDY